MTGSIDDESWRGWFRDLTRWYLRIDTRNCGRSLDFWFEFSPNNIRRLILESWSLGRHLIRGLHSSRERWVLILELYEAWLIVLLAHLAECPGERERWVLALGVLSYYRTRRQGFRVVFRAQLDGVEERSGPGWRTRKRGLDNFPSPLGGGYENMVYSRVSWVTVRDTQKTSMKARLLCYLARFVS